MERAEKTSTTLWARIKAAHAKAFVSRQIILRSDGKVRFITLSTRVQTAGAVIALMGFSWVVYSATALVTVDYEIASRDRAIEDKSQEVVEVRGAYNDLVEQVRSYHRRFAEASSELADNQNKLLGLLGQNSELKEDLTSTVERLESVSSMASTTASVLTNKEQALDGLLDQNLLLQSDLVITLKKLETVESERAEVEARADQLSGELRSLENELQDLSGRNLTLESGLTTLEAEISRVNRERQDAIEESEAYEKRVQELEDRIASLQRSQQDFLLHLAERTISTIDEAERTIAMTGLGVEELLDRARSLPVGQGGPFVELSSEMLASSELKHEVSVVDSHMERWGRLQYILRALPLTAPVDSYRLTSGFGKRKDPINGRWAMHAGVDFAGPLRSPILATSAGTVVHAGWNANYGRMVEVDHGMGIRTRYGHLKSISVKKGDRVAFREKIGLLGSSGRSTGPHVHYEVLIDGRSLDPLKFLKAGKYVFKG